MIFKLIIKKKVLDNKHFFNEFYSIYINLFFTFNSFMLYANQKLENLTDPPMKHSVVSMITNRIPHSQNKQS
jgi:hypothetical protein